MEVYRIKCLQCGFQIRAEAEANSHLKIYCESCRREIFPEQPPQAAAKTPIAAAPAKKMVGEYEIIQQIGQGGMGKVYLAKHETTGEKVVVKMLSIEDFDETKRDKFTDYFFRETQVLKGIQHESIVQYKTCGNFRGHPYLAMEFVDGKTLEAELKEQGSMKLTEAIPILLKLIVALEYIEAQKIIHRDIKPGNIILCAHNKLLPKLIDFGLAKSLTEEYSLTKTGSMMGTPFYMPPEQTLDAKSADHRADIYALGATFYHMLAGKPPFFEYNAQGRSAVLEAIRKKKPAPLATLRPKLPKDICTMVEKAMAFAVQDRYATASQWKKETNQFLDSLQGKR
jgi:serine/threonine-protein kinase